MQFEQKKRKTKVIRISKKRIKNRRHLSNKKKTDMYTNINQCKDVMNTYIESDTPRKGIDLTVSPIKMMCLQVNIRRTMCFFC
jgi:hypothetical protein